ncbi:hypothetical protein D9M68_873990 [compost metagenome]
MAGGELLQGFAGSAGILLDSGGAEVGANEHDSLLPYHFRCFLINVALWVLLFKESVRESSLHPVSI